jgi:hypothetical protein
MKNWMVLCVTTVLMSTTVLAAEPVNIASTSFENEAIGNTYSDTNTDGLTDHDLINNPGQSHVDSTASSTTAGNLGFDAAYVNTRNDFQGMSDSANVGVVNSLGSFAAYPDGSQGYVMGNSDGKMTLTFDPVNLSDYTDRLFSMQVFINSGTTSIWETSDYITITLALAGTANITLLDSTGSDIDSMKLDSGQWLAGYWRTLSTPILDAATSASLIVTIDSDAATETMYLDDIHFTGQVPEPASMTIMVLGALAVLRRKTAR